MDSDWNQHDLLSRIGEIFSAEHDLVTHYGILDEGDRDFLLFDKEQMAEKRIVMKVDYLPATGFGTYVAEKSKQAKKKVNLDGVETEFHSEFALVGKSSGIVKTLLRYFDPNLKTTPAVFVAHISGGRCWILGFSWLKNFEDMSRSELDYMQYCAALIVESLHDMHIESSKFRVRVHSSIYDRVKNDNYSFSAKFVTEKWGILKDPSVFFFSPKVEKELSILPGSSCTLFRDEEHIIVIVREEDAERLIRLPFTELIDSKGKIRSSRVATSVKRNTALKRDGSGISGTSLKNRLKRILRHNSRIGFTLTARSLGAELGEEGSTWTYDEEAVTYSNLIPRLIFLRFAKYSDNLWNKSELSSPRESLGGRIKNKSQTGKKYSRILNWGNDKIGYISLGKGRSVSSHWVDSHTKRVRLKLQTTISDYKRRGLTTYKIGSQTFGICFVESYFKGKSGKSNWDGYYNFGNRPRNYSQMAIRWIKWRMENDGVTIQHAELGGEKRFSLANGRWIAVDGWCEETNTVYEFHGDIFHGNPETIDPDSFCNPFRKDLTAKQLYELTKEKENHIISLGFKLVTIWESDWIEQEKRLTKG